MLTPEDLPILTAVGVVCVAGIVSVTVVGLLRDWFRFKAKLRYQRRLAEARCTRKLRNVDRFNTWQAALTWFYTYDRKTPVPHDQGCSAAFLNWLFAPIPENVK